MSSHVLIIGGRGRIGRQVAADILRHTTAQVTVTGRSQKPGPLSFGDRGHYLPLELADRAAVEQAIRALGTDREPKNVVVHCAGPFLQRDAHVLQTCIEAGVNYVDVSDHPSFTRQAQAHRGAAVQAGVTALINTGVFPGISNSMARAAVEQLDRAEAIHLSYAVAGSGGAGVTVLRTTFLSLQQPFSAWIGGQWQTIKPYRDRQLVEFPPPYGRLGVYWFEVAETLTLAESFPVQTVTTRFGSAPDFYNYLTGAISRLPQKVLQSPWVVESLAQVSFAMTQMTNRWSGVGIAIRADVTGQLNHVPTTVTSTLVHPNTAIAVGSGTGSVVQYLLTGQLRQPGVWPVEQAISTALFEQTLQSRGMQLQQQIQPAIND